MAVDRAPAASAPLRAGRFAGSGKSDILFPLRWAAIAIVVCFACAPAEQTFHVPADPESKSTLIAIESRAGFELRGIERARTGAAQISGVHVEDGDEPRVTAVFLARSLEELMLPSGIITEAAPAGPARAWPMTTSIVQGVLGDSTEFSPLSTLPERLANFRLPPLDPIACAGAGGCFSGSDTETVCLTPCPAPEAPAAPTPPAPPAPPAPPSFEPCPQTWTLEPPASAGEPKLCRPPNIPQPVPCNDPDRAQFFAEADCTAIGTPCPIGQFPENIAGGTGNLIYVLPGATPGGDGSSAAPYATISEALARALPFDTLALGKGTFVENINLTIPIQVIGACPAETHLVGDTTTSTATIIARAPGITLRNLHLGGPTRALRARGETTTVELEGVLIEGPGRSGLSILDAATVIATGVVLRDWSHDAINFQSTGELTLRRAVIEKTADRGLNLCGRAHLDRVVIRNSVAPALPSISSDPLLLRCGGPHTLEDVLVERAPCEAGILVDSSTATLTRVYVRDLDSRTDGSAGYGILAVNGAQLTADTIAIDRTRACAFEVHGGRTRAEAQNLVIRETREEADRGDRGDAVCLLDHARAELRRLFVERSRRNAIVAYDGAELILADAWIRAATSTKAARGLTVDYGAKVEIDRLRVDDPIGHGFVIFGATTTATITDLYVRRPIPAGKETGQGVVIDKAAVSLRRALIEDTHDFGLFVGGPTVAQLRDVEIAGVEQRINNPEADAAIGIGIADGAGAWLERVHLRRIRGVGILAPQSDRPVTMIDLALDEQLETVLESQNNGILIDGPREVRLERISIEARRGLGFAAALDDADLHGSDVIVRGSSPAFKLESGTRGRVERLDLLGGGVSISRRAIVSMRDLKIAGARRTSDLLGYGLEVRDSATLDVEHFTIDSSEDAGLVVVSGFDVGDAFVDLHRGVIDSNPVGAHIRRPGLDLGRLLDGVIFRANGIDFQVGD